MVIPRSRSSTAAPSIEWPAPSLSGAASLLIVGWRILVALRSHLCAAEAAGRRSGNLMQLAGWLLGAFGVLGVLHVFTGERAWFVWVAERRLLGKGRVSLSRVQRSSCWSCAHSPRTVNMPLEPAVRAMAEEKAGCFTREHRGWPTRGGWHGESAGNSSGTTSRAARQAIWRPKSAKSPAMWRPPFGLSTRCARPSGSKAAIRDSAMSLVSRLEHGTVYEATFMALNCDRRWRRSTRIFIARFRPSRATCLRPVIQFGWPCYRRSRFSWASPPGCTPSCGDWGGCGFELPPASWFFAARCGDRAATTGAGRRPRPADHRCSSTWRPSIRAD